MNKWNDGTGIQEKRTKGKLKSYLNEILMKKKVPQGNKQNTRPRIRAPRLSSAYLGYLGLGGGD